jgi:hypothetical protein
MDRAPSGSIPIHGIFKNFNTIEEFRATDPKKELFNQLTDSVSLITGVFNGANTVDIGIIQNRHAKLEPFLTGHFCRPEEIRLPLLVRIPRFGL